MRFKCACIGTLISLFPTSIIISISSYDSSMVYFLVGAGCLIGYLLGTVIEKILDKLEQIFRPENQTGKEKE